MPLCVVALQAHTLPTQKPPTIHHVKNLGCQWLTRPITHPTQTNRTDSTAANQGNPGPGAGYGWSSLTGDGLVATLSKAGLGAR